MGFATRLKQLREQAGLTQAELAGKAGMHLMGIAKLEQSVREPSWATVQALCSALQVDCTAFTEPPTSAPEPRRRGRPKKAAQPAQDATAGGEAGEGSAGAGKQSARRRKPRKRDG